MKKLLTILIINLGLISCQKEVSEYPKPQCYVCVVNIPGVQANFDTCMVNIRDLDMRNENGVGLPWKCTLKKP